MNATEEIDSANKIGQILREEKKISKGYFSATLYNCCRLKSGSHTSKHVLCQLCFNER